MEPSTIPCIFGVLHHVICRQDSRYRVIHRSIGRRLGCPARRSFDATAMSTFVRFNPKPYFVEHPVRCLGAMLRAVGLQAYPRPTFLHATVAPCRHSRHSGGSLSPSPHSAIRSGVRTEGGGPEEQPAERPAATAEGDSGRHWHNAKRGANMTEHCAMCCGRRWVPSN